MTGYQMSEYVYAQALTHALNALSNFDKDQKLQELTDEQIDRAKRYAYMISRAFWRTHGCKQFADPDFARNGDTPNVWASYPPKLENERIVCETCNGDTVIPPGKRCPDC